MLHRAPAAALAAMALGALWPSPAAAQYFGRNKVQYREFNFEVLQTEHFDIHYYPEERAKVEHVSRLAERWYSRLSRLFAHELEGRQPLIFYASGSDFRQTNAIGGELGEGTGGVTEAFKRRIVMPSAGSLAETDHVLGHELVHAFQYDMSAKGKNVGGGFLRLPLWFVEGLAEYLSLGPLDPQTAMWLRDSLEAKKLPTLRDLGNPRFFPYRYGHAFWAYVGGRWGDEVIGSVFTSAMRSGSPEAAIKDVLETTPEDFSRDWRESITSAYARFVEAGKAPSAYGPVLVDEKRGGGELNVGPALSPDGSRVVYLSERSLFSVDLFIADTKTGKVLGKLASTATDPHFDSLQFIESAGTFSADGRLFVQSAIVKGHGALVLLDPQSGKRVREIPFKDLEEVQTPTVSPDGRSIAFAALRGGLLDLWLYDLDSGSRRQLTSDAFAELQPVFSPDGRRLAFVTDRFTTRLETLAFGPYRLALLDLATGSIEPLPAYEGAKHLNPQFSPDGRSLYFIADVTGASNVHRLDLDSGLLYQVTDLRTGVAGITPLSPALSVARESGRIAFTAREAGKYNIYAIDDAALRQGERSESLEFRTAAALLPPRKEPAGEVADLKADAETGLPSPAVPPPTPYKPKLGLDYVGQPSVGVGVDRFGTYVGGGSALFFSDMLGDRNLGVAFQVYGSLEDTVAQVSYTNLKGRFDWAVGLERLPYLSAGGYIQEVGEIGGQPVVSQSFYQERQTYTTAFAMGALAFNRSRRIEVSGSFQRVGFSQEIQTEVYSLVDGSFLGDSRQDLPDPYEPLNLGSVSAAFVHDSSIFGATSPIVGSRARFEVSPTFGSITYTSALADARAYFMPVRPLTAAVRVLQYGRYGGGSEDPRFQSLYLGYPTFIRGYDGITADECVPDARSACPVYDQLFGSRILVANFELRGPLFGLLKGRLAYGPLPLEIGVFADAGVAWTADDKASFLGGERKLLTSVGATARLNFFGLLVIEAALAHPLDRPARSWVWQWNFRPGF
jgi:Tol biopolymer transport system component